MDGNNWRAAQAQPQGGGGEGAGAAAGAIDPGDWRTQLLPDSRQRIVNKIMKTFERHFPVSGPEGVQELKKIAVRFEEKIYSAATSQVCSLNLFLFVRSLLHFSFDVGLLMQFVLQDRIRKLPIPLSSNMVLLMQFVLQDHMRNTPIPFSSDSGILDSICCRRPYKETAYPFFIQSGTLDAIFSPRPYKEITHPFFYPLDAISSPRPYGTLDALCCPRPFSSDMGLLMQFVPQVHIRKSFIPFSSNVGLLMQFVLQDHIRKPPIPFYMMWGSST